jgi:hypothetical protein
MAHLCDVKASAIEGINSLHRIDSFVSLPSHGVSLGHSMRRQPYKNDAPVKPFCQEI